MGKRKPPKKSPSSNQSRGSRFPDLCRALSTNATTVILEAASDQAIAAATAALPKVVNVPVKVALSTEPGKTNSEAFQSVAESPIVNSKSTEAAATVSTYANKPAPNAGTDSWARRSIRRRRSRSPALPAAAVQKATLGNENANWVPVKGKEAAGLVWTVKSSNKSQSTGFEDSVSGSVSVQSEGLTLGLNKIELGDLSSGRLVSNNVAAGNREESGQETYPDFGVE
ncbi:unnamed protein product [Arabidopsis arenosa]|uniref:Uncharacterized protein n=1 Tax=Arabidopsis arenosa TaxID=38785 RepID=A0A8S1ZHS3_ARAAE|nr:unnamed protein product [Arabidopsis arenosa]